MEFAIIATVGILIAVGLYLGVTHLLKKPLKGPAIADVNAAAKIVWVDLWGLDIKRLPTLIWVLKDRLNCRMGTGWLDKDGQCVAGNSWEDSWACSFAWPEGTTKLSQTAFVHELRHARAWLEPITNDHFSAAFQADVAAGNAALEAAGR